MSARDMARRAADRVAWAVRRPPDHQVMRQLQRQLDDGTVVRGVGSYGNPDVNVLARAGSEPPHVTIGRYCSFGPGVKMVVNGDHRSDWVTTWPARILLGLEGAERDGHPQASGPIVIGNDVWIGTEALILGGVTIGDGAVVAARAVVTHDVRPYAIVAGMPAVERRRRFDDDVVERLLALRWWDLEPDQVAEAVDVLCHAPELDRLEQRVAELRAGQRTPSSSSVTS